MKNRTPHAKTATHRHKKSAIDCSSSEVKWTGEHRTFLMDEGSRCNLDSWNFLCRMSSAIHEQYYEHPVDCGWSCLEYSECLFGVASVHIRESGLGGSGGGAVLRRQRLPGWGRVTLAPHDAQEGICRSGPIGEGPFTPTSSTAIGAPGTRAVARLTMTRRSRCSRWRCRAETPAMCVETCSAWSTCCSQHITAKKDVIVHDKIRVNCLSSFFKLL